MKKLLLAVMLVITSFSIKADAQLNISINIGAQPNWGPTGYNHVDYYYLPAIESYYSVSTGEFIYRNGRDWVFTKQLPGKYRNFDLYSAYKVVVNEPRPYQNFRTHLSKYAYLKDQRGRQELLRNQKARNDRTYYYSDHKNDRNNRNDHGARPEQRRG